MKTTASNRKIRVLIDAFRKKTLNPQPEFQRRLVWTNRDKCAFIQTVLQGYPFPEIYIAAGDINLETGEGNEMLVDGQQRITTLYQYFIGSSDLKLKNDITSYKNLSNQEKEAFLEYDVVVRDLGKMNLGDIKDIFERINSTSYSLNAMEIHNARFNGELKKFAEEMVQWDFFENNRVFTAGEIRRMQDTRFSLIIIITILSTYFNRDSELENYLGTYNDEFPMSKDVEEKIKAVLEVIENCKFEPSCRIWKKADLFTLIVELHSAVYKHNKIIDHNLFKINLKDFYNKVDSSYEDNDVETYRKACQQATNDRNNRLIRGEIVRNIIYVSVKK